MRNIHLVAFYTVLTPTRHVTVSSFSVTVFISLGQNYTKALSSQMFSLGCKTQRLSC